MEFLHNALCESIKLDVLKVDVERDDVVRKAVRNSVVITAINNIFSKELTLFKKRY